jgi:uncharacterized protein (TIGR02246 family)
MRLLARSIAIACLAVLALIFEGTTPGFANALSLSASDRAEIQAVLEHYRSGWLSGDADAVRSTFASDAVLIPHHGVAPVVGMVSINQFWWPASSAKTIITRFRQTLDEIGGDRNIAYVRGRSEVAWRIEDGRVTESWHNAGNFMALLQHTDGKWRISHLMWDDPPNQRID